LFKRRINLYLYEEKIREGVDLLVNFNTHQIDDYTLFALISRREKVVLILRGIFVPSKKIAIFCV